MAAGWSRLVLLSCCTALVLVTSDDSDLPIIYKTTSYYEKMWDDRGSGANMDVSYWRPKSLAYDYFALGDVVVASHNAPQTVAMLAKANVAGSLAPPAGFTEIWRDRGSGADKDVKIFKMIPQAGYTCIGNVVVEGYGTPPDASKYRCVKSQYVVSGDLFHVWNDRGSGAAVDVSSWQIMRGANLYAIETGNFLSRASHSRPDDTPYLINSHFAKNHLKVNVDTTNKNAKIQLYKINDFELIWKDSGSGADRDFSCWRVKGPSGYYSLGDVPKGDYHQPTYGLLAKELEVGALDSPVDFWPRWYDGGSGASWDGAFWEPRCNPGYVAMGHVCTLGYNKPDASVVRCVHVDLVQQGRWEWVWSDRGSGAHQDASVYKAVANTGGQQGVEAMGTIQSHGGMDKDAYVLQGALTSMVDGKPVKKYTLTNVNYNLDDRKIVGSELDNLARLIVENKGSTPQQGQETLSATWSETRSWSVSVGITIGVSLEVEAGVPLMASSKVTTTVTTSFSMTTGTSVTESKTKSTTATVTVQPRSRKSVFLVGTTYKADVPFTCDIMTEYADGTIGRRYHVTGTYTGVNVADSLILYGPDVPLQ